MVKVKALYVLQCREYVLLRHGQEGIERVSSCMAPAARAAVYAPLLLATDWIDVTYAIEHALAYDRVYARAHDREASERMITDLVIQHYKGLYRSMFVGVATPYMVLEKSSRLWSRFYDQGDSELISQGPNSVIKRIVGCPDMPRHHDILTRPYYEELVRQAGASSVASRHLKCVGLGADCCETLIQWRHTPTH